MRRLNLDILNKWLKPFMPLFTLVIAMSAGLAILFLIFRVALSPIDIQVNNHIPTQIKELKANLEHLQKNQEQLQTNLEQLQTSQEQLQRNQEQLQTNQEQLQKNQNLILQKLDDLNKS